MFVSQIIDEASEVLATTDYAKVYRKLTQAVQTLMESGHYFHAISEVDVCTGWDGVTVTLPRNVEVPLAVNVDGSPTYFRNRLFQYHVNKGGMYNNVQWAWDDRGMVATQMQITQPSELVAISEHETDSGLQLRVIGTDSNNRELRTQLKDGTLVDGLLVPVHAQRDFPYGTIAPDGATIETRSLKVSPLTDLISASIHQLLSGQAVVLNANVGTVPSPLDAGGTYYVGKIDDNTINLHESPLDAQNGINPINFDSIAGTTSVNVVDTRTASLFTVLATDSEPTIALDSPNEITFTTLPVGSGGSGVLPSPLAEKLTYFTQRVENQTYQVYASIADATNNTNPVLLSGNSGKFSVNFRKPIEPQTKLTFTLSPNFSAGDVVQCYTNGGTLPQPIIAGQNYYVGQVVGDTNAITLHLNYSDAVAGLNPINFITAGSGQNSVAKLLDATASGGTQNNIAVSNFNLSTASGSGATVQAFPSGIVTSTSIQASPPNGYTAATTSATLDDSGGYGYTSTTAKPKVEVVGGAPLNPATVAASNITISTDTFTGKNYISAITMADTGQGYSTVNPPSVVISGNVLTAGGVHAVASPVLSLANSIASVTVLTGGTNYSASTTATITNVSGGTGVGATCSVQVVGGVILGITVVLPGKGYNNGATITLANIGSGTLATFQVNLSTTDYSVSAIQLQRRGSGALLDVNVNNTSGTVSALTIVSPGSGYLYPPRVTIVSTNSPAPAVVRGGVDITTSFINNYLVTASGSGYNADPAVYITGGGGSGATATTITNSRGIGAVFVVNGGSGYTPGLTATISDSVGGSGTGAACNVSLSGGSISSITVTSAGSGYSSPRITFSQTPSGGSNYPATVSFSFTRVVTGVTPVTAGTGYTSPPTVTIIPSTGVFVQFASTGTLPSPLVQGATYRAENPSSGSTFTVKNLDFSEINITSSGSGNLYLVLSRTFGTGFTGLWNGDFNGVTSGQKVFLGTDYILPITNPVVTDTSSNIYINKISQNTAELWLDAITTADGGTKISVVNLGTGQAYYALRVNSYAKSYNNSIYPETVDYLTNGMLVRFTASGSLPFPLVSGTDYKLVLSGDKFNLTTTGGVPISFINVSVPTLAVGLMQMVISRTLTPKKSTTIIADKLTWDTGTEIQVRPSDGDVLPTGLQESTPSTQYYYYVRDITGSTFELYATRSQALSLASVVGRINFVNIGKTINSTFIGDSILAPTLIKTISHIEKPDSVGYISLYAFDYGRSNDMTLIGQYHPSETNPQYRRIRLGKPCAWARIAYRVASPNITSVYDYIPLENSRAILAALHAVDLEDKDFAEQAQRYWMTAFAYLKNQNDSMDGHAMSPPQINNITYGDGTDVVMF